MNPGRLDQSQKCSGEEISVITFSLAALGQGSGWIGELLGVSGIDQIKSGTFNSLIIGVVHLYRSEQK